ncbi:MAG: DUF4831 family protein [Prevotellaceae bacterium]|jgi:hypothetical protein|nr:DUF4831 family protein [Prevotellaceae bacterium]
MKKIILQGICLFLTNAIIAQTAVLNVKESGSMKEEPVATYFLPRTVLEIEVVATKITRKAGPYSNDAGKYLGTSATIRQDEEIWTITKIDVKQNSEPDAGNQYKVYATAKSNAGFLSLTETGILRGINLPFSIFPEGKNNMHAARRKPGEKTKKSKNTPFISNFAIKEDSLAKKPGAAAAFEQINDLREARQEILVQNNDVLHGEAVKLYLREINKRENELTALFNGKEQKETVKRTFTVYPDREVTNQEIFRFSEKQGFSDSGNPVSITLKKRLTGDKSTSSGKEKQGFVYRIPALTDVEIAGNKETFWTGIILISQLGKLTYFPAGFFDKDVKALFDVQSGTLLQTGK